jgi:hypothetical protein
MSELQVTASQKVRTPEPSSVENVGYEQLLSIARDVYRKHHATSAHLRSERTAIYRERSKELKEMFRKMELDLQKLTDLDNRFVKESLEEAERLRAAYLRAGKSDLTNYLAEKAAQAYALGSNERLLLTGTVATFDQRLLESSDPPGAPPPQFGDQRNDLDLRADGYGTYWWEYVNQFNSPFFSFTWKPDSTTYYSFSSFLHFLGYSLFCGRSPMVQ